MAVVAELVCPFPQAVLGQFRYPSESPGGVGEPGVVRGKERGSGVHVVGVTEPAVQGAGIDDAFRDVFRQVVPDRERSEFPALDTDVPDIGLLAPTCDRHRGKRRCCRGPLVYIEETTIGEHGQRVGQRRQVVGAWVRAGLFGMGDRPAPAGRQQLPRRPDRRRRPRPVRGGGVVEAEQGVEVHRAPGLSLGNLHIGDPDRLPAGPFRDAFRPGHAPVGQIDGAFP